MIEQCLAWLVFAGWVAVALILSDIITNKKMTLESKGGSVIGGFILMCCLLDISNEVLGLF